MSLLKDGSGRAMKTGTKKRAEGQLIRKHLAEG